MQFHANQNDSTSKQHNWSILTQLISFTQQKQKADSGKALVWFLPVHGLMFLLHTVLHVGRHQD